MPTLLTNAIHFAKATFGSLATRHREDVPTIEQIKDLLLRSSEKLASSKIGDSEQLRACCQVEKLLEKHIQQIESAPVQFPFTPGEQQMLSMYDTKISVEGHSETTICYNATLCRQHFITRGERAFLNFIKTGDLLDNAINPLLVTRPITKNYLLITSMQGALTQLIPSLRGAHKESDASTLQEHKKRLSLLLEKIANNLSV